MSTVIHVGGIKVSALNDGEVHLPPMYYPGLDFGAHPELLQADGTYHIPVGCFLIQAEDRTVLVDAGLGPSTIPFPADIAAAAGLADPPESIAAGGLLPGALAAAGVAPADITTVFLTHLHADHIGWIAPGGVLFFPNAVVMCGAVEWQTPPIAPAPGELEGRMGLAVAQAAGVLHLLDAATVELAPGVSAHHSPGHTPGHYVVSVSSNGEKAYLLGDAVHHPLQLNDKGISFLSETEPERALRAREELLTTLQGRNVSIGVMPCDCAFGEVGRADPVGTRPQPATRAGLAGTFGAMENSAALATGASKGIGKEIARQLAAVGFGPYPSRSGVLAWKGAVR